jgi:sulfite exporter TauE/SafE
VPIDLLTLSAAFLGGLMGSVHCIAMCGGIATGLGAAAGAGDAWSGHRAALAAAATLNLARVSGYAVAGLAAGLLGWSLAGLVDLMAWDVALRVALGLVLVVIGLRAAGIGRRFRGLRTVGVPVWRWLAPLQRRLMPASTLSRRWALGVLWGWLPCGLSGSLLLVAWLEADALRGMLVMLAFGLGTLPAMVPLTWSGARLSGLFAGTRGRRLGGIAIILAGLVTAAAPWLMRIPALHPALQLLGCRPA